DARYSEKRGTGWEDYKSPLSETCDEPKPDGTRQAPNLITNVATTEASVPDAAMTEPVHDMLAVAGLLPGEHAVDAGYPSADLLLGSRARGIPLLGPLLSGSPPQARLRAVLWLASRKLPLGAAAVRSLRGQNPASAPDRSGGSRNARSPSP